jgi:hypothetical protein
MVVTVLRDVRRWIGEALHLVDRDERADGWPRPGGDWPSQESPSQESPSQESPGQESPRQDRPGRDGAGWDRPIPEQSRPTRPDGSSRSGGGTVYHQGSRKGEQSGPDGRRPGISERDGCQQDHRQRAGWAPPVVGQPAAEFEARPPNASVYRPDCLADGWSTSQFTVRVASVRGYEHRFSGKPRQDDAAIAHHPATGAVLFAIADGVSDAPLSHIGSSAACRAAISAMTAALDSPEKEVDWPALVRQAAWQLCEQAKMSLRLPKVDQRLADENMATTLVAGLVLPTPDGPDVQLIQVGDSSAWILNRQGRFQCLLPTKFRAGQEVISSATAALPRVPPVEVRRGILAGDEILLVGTDGFGDPLGDGEGAVGRHFANALSSIPPVLKFANDLDFSRETWDDDRTLFALWPRRRRSRSA